MGFFRFFSNFILVALISVKNRIILYLSHYIAIINIICYIVVSSHATINSMISKMENKMKKLSTDLLISTITSRRKLAGYTQATLASLSGINRSMIGRIENGEYIPTIEQLQKLGEVLGFEVTDLFVDDSASNSSPSIKLDKTFKYCCCRNWICRIVYCMFIITT